MKKESSGPLRRTDAKYLQRAQRADSCLQGCVPAYPDDLATGQAFVIYILSHIDDDYLKILIFCGRHLAFVVFFEMVNQNNLWWTYNMKIIHNSQKINVRFGLLHDHVISSLLFVKASVNLTIFLIKLQRVLFAPCNTMAT